MLSLAMQLGLSVPMYVAPHQLPPRPQPVAVVAPAPVVQHVVTSAPVTTTTVAPAQPGAQPVGPSVTVTATDCTVTWQSTQTNPVNGQSGTYPVTYYGSCDVANQMVAPGGIAAGGTVTTTAPFTYTTGG
jgi:hypothetical protein